MFSDSRHLNFGCAILFVMACYPICAYCEVLSEQWRTLSHVQNMLGISKYTWDGNSLCFSNDQQNVCFYAGRRKLLINGTTVWLNVAPEGSVTAGDWRLATIDLDLLQLAVFTRYDGEIKPLRVMLDPGHGGEDAGALSENPLLMEKDLVLTIAKQIGVKLEASAIQVDYTRTNDLTLALDERSRLSQDKKSDLLISIHANHANNQEASGVETYILPPHGYSGTATGSNPRGWQIGNRNDYNNTMLGFLIHQSLITTTNTLDRGLKRQAFFVLRETICPAVLIECGFLSNQAETLRMLSVEWQDKCASAVAQGVFKYAQNVISLNQAVAKKLIHDELIKQQTLSLVGALAVPAPIAEKPLPLPIATTEQPVPPLLPAPSSLSNVLAVTTSSLVSGTNTAPTEIEALINFYTN